ncbi:ENR1 protein, partial [Chunga burmeisteri]|nr:ENR1 protein [Chunga burmeisteri]
QQEKLSWCNDTQTNPFKGIDTLRCYWENPDNSAIGWVSPDGLFWVCGERVYTRLPKKWKGSGTTGIIQPAFLLPPKGEEKTFRNAL